MRTFSIIVNDIAFQCCKRPYRQRSGTTCQRIDAMPIGCASLILLLHPFPAANEVRAFVIETHIMVFSIPGRSRRHRPFVHFLSAVRTRRFFLYLHLSTLFQRLTFPVFVRNRQGKPLGQSGLQPGRSKEEAPPGARLSARRIGLHYQSVKAMTGFFIISHSPVLGSHFELTKTFQFFSSIFGKSDLK